MKKPAFDFKTIQPIGVTNSRLRYGWRQQLVWLYTATGPIVPFFAVNNFDNPYEQLILKAIRFNAFFANAAANITALMEQGWLVRVGSNTMQPISPLLNAVSSGATSPGAVLSSLTQAEFVIPRELTGALIECEYIFAARQIITTTCQPLGNTATAAPAGPLVALNDQMQIRMDLYFDSSK